MQKNYTKTDLRIAFLSGFNQGIEHFTRPDDERIEQIIESFINGFHDEQPPTEPKDFPVTVATIKYTCGWSKWCDVVGGNHYMLNEFTVEDSEIYYCTKSQAKSLGILQS